MLITNKPPAVVITHTLEKAIRKDNGNFDHLRGTITVGGNGRPCQTFRVHWSPSPLEGAHTLKADNLYARLNDFFNGIRSFFCHHHAETKREWATKFLNSHLALAQKSTANAPANTASPTASTPASCPAPLATAASHPPEAVTNLLGPRTPDHQLTPLDDVCGPQRQPAASPDAQGAPYSMSPRRSSTGPLSSPPTQSSNDPMTTDSSVTERTAQSRENGHAPAPGNSGVLPAIQSGEIHATSFASALSERAHRLYYQSAQTRLQKPGQFLLFQDPITATYWMYRMTTSRTIAIGVVKKNSDGRYTVGGVRKLADQTFPNLDAVRGALKTLHMRDKTYYPPAVSKVGNATTSPHQRLG